MIQHLTRINIISKSLQTRPKKDILEPNFRSPKGRRPLSDEDYESLATD